MWSNPGVIDLFIDQEIARLVDQESDSVRMQLATCAKSIFRGQISIDGAYQVFQPYPAAAPLLKQIQQILEMSDVPLPDLGEGKPPHRKSDPWTAAEDLRLLVAVARFGAKDWRWISSFLGAGRSPNQCNQRWCRALDPAISHRSWEDEEDQKLLRAVEVLGKTSWCQIAKIVSGRTDLQCRYRYLQIVKRTQVPAVEPAKLPPPAAENIRKRRNSISIAPFANLDVLRSVPPMPMLPYYLESSLEPRNDPTQPCLHRIPPLLFSRKTQI
jgi:hypothetical protein